MAEHEQDAAVDTATKPERRRRRGTRRPANKPPVTESPAMSHAEPEQEHRHHAAPVEPMSRPGVFKVLWADIRGKRLPYQPTAEELSWEAEEQAAEAEARAKMAAGTDLDADRFEALRRRISTRPS